MQIRTALRAIRITTKSRTNSHHSSCASLLAPRAVPSVCCANACECPTGLRVAGGQSGNSGTCLPAGRGGGSTGPKGFAFALRARTSDFERAATHTIVSAAPIATVVPSCSSSLIFLLPVIQRTLYPNTWFVEDVGVDHCRAHISFRETRSPVRVACRGTRLRPGEGMRAMRIRSHLGLVRPIGFCYSVDRTAIMYATTASRSAGFRLARCDIVFTIFGQSSTL